MTINWNKALLDQIDFHWGSQLRPRLEGLSDAEYFWEPVPAWNVRPRTGAEGEPGRGTHTVDFAFPAPSPAPFTTIAWRLAHVIVGVLAMRNAGHFAAPEASYQTWQYAGGAAEALAQLDEQYAVWSAGVRDLGEEGLLLPCGPTEGPYAAEPLGVLVLHINRELIHHGAEIALLRDLYLHTR